jgi:hypothetical protein
METYFTRLCEDIYTSRFVDSVVEYFGGKDSIAEAFFSIRAQMNVIVDEHEIALWDAEKQNQQDWTLDTALDAADEIAMLAHKQNSPAWPALHSLAGCMRAMVRSQGIAPVTHFKQSEKDGITTGFARLLVRDDIRPVDLVFASVAGDSDPAMPLSVAAAAERDACREVVEKHLKRILGDDKSDPSELASEDQWAYGLIADVRDDIAARDPNKEDDA